MGQGYKTWAGDVAGLRGHERDKWNALQCVWCVAKLSTMSGICNGRPEALGVGYFFTNQTLSI